MQRTVPVVSVVLACSACVVAPDPVVSTVAGEVAPDDATCRDYHAQATVDGQPQDIVGRACRQSDGSWQVSEGPAGGPPQMMIIYPPPPPSFYDPWLWDFPIGFSLGAAVVFVDRQHHLHHMQIAGLRRFHLARGGIHAVPVHPAAGGMAGMHRG